MKKTGFNWFAPLVWTGFATFACWAFWKILSDREDISQLATYQGMMVLIVLGTLLVTTYQSWQIAKADEKVYQAFEAIFPELSGNFSLLKEKADYCDEIGHLAIYKGYLFNNWSPKAFVNLNEVVSLRAYRTLGIKSRTGTVAGNKPKLVFRDQFGKETELSITTMNTLSHAKNLLTYLSQNFPHIQFED